MKSKINFLILEPNHPLRKKAEIFINSIYTNEYSAVIKEFPKLIGVSIDGSGKILSACSIRLGDEKLFSTIYLNKSELKKINTFSLIEVTTLASISRLALWNLLAEVANFARARDCNAMIFTATKKLRHILNQACLGSKKIAKASRKKIANADQWGTYYDSDPWVCLIKDEEQFSKPQTIQQAS